MKKLIYHKIDKKLVKKTINEKILNNKEQMKIIGNEIKELENKEQNESNLKLIKSLKLRVNFIKESIKKEKVYYSKAQVIEDANKNKNEDRFYLTYTPKDSKGTGPFKSLAKAKKWFTSQGR